MNKHQKNAVIAVMLKLEICGDKGCADLLRAMLDNDHDAMLSSDVYWSKPSKDRQVQ